MRNTKNLAWSQTSAADSSKTPVKNSFFFLSDYLAVCPATKPPLRAESLFIFLIPYSAPLYKTAHLFFGRVTTWPVHIAEPNNSIRI
jgi:hypothetical protein